MLINKCKFHLCYFVWDEYINCFEILDKQKAKWVEVERKGQQLQKPQEISSKQFVADLLLSNSILELIIEVSFSFSHQSFR